MIHPSLSMLFESDKNEAKYSIRRDYLCNNYYVGHSYNFPLKITKSCQNLVFYTVPCITILSIV